MNHALNLLLTGLGWLAAMAAAQTAERARVEWEDVTVTLTDALINAGAKKDLMLHFQHKDGVWDPNVLGFAGFERELSSRTYNVMDHEGTIAEKKVEGATTSFTIPMTIHDDPWVKGGTALYELRLTRQGKALTGEFTGTFNGTAVQGPVKGEAKVWPAFIKGLVPYQPGEHPRLIFRKADLAALKQKAETPEGKVILARLKKMLEGPFTMWHGCGYGFLYQLTGDKQYADEAKRQTDKALTGTKDSFNAQYFWTPQGNSNKMRAGPSAAAIILAYDLCYDAWPADYRERIARSLQDTIAATLLIESGGGQLWPGSNHYGPWNCGAALAILGLADDPATDPEKIARCRRIFERRAKRTLYAGFSERAYFFEGTNCGRISTNLALANYLQAARVAEGWDLVSSNETAQWLLSKWVYEIVRQNDRPDNYQRGMYAREFNRDRTSEGGDFGQGFGIVPEAHKAAVLWFYNHAIEPPGTERTYDAITYPQRAVYAFVNWPIGLAERHPAEVFPPVLADEGARYFVFRSGWSDNGDVIVTLRDTVAVLGLGLRVAFPGTLLESSKPDAHNSKTNVVGAKLQSSQKGVSVVTVYTGDQAKPRAGSLAVDFSGACGAPVLVAMAGGTPGQPRDQAKPGGASTKTHVLKAGETTFVIMTLQTGPAPEAKVDGEKVIVGKRSLRFDGEKIVLEK